jgi:uncharacterized protein with FMN-binding domain
MRRVLICAGGVLAGAIAVLAAHAVATPTSRELTTQPDPSTETIDRPLRDGTATGDVAATAYGPVQVRVTVTGGAIVDIEALVTPNLHERSRWIAANLVPELRQRVLTAQTADVDVMSGATFTSGGYLRSLQSALDQLT